MIREIRYLIYLLCVVIVLGRVQSEYFIHHHCYQEGGACDTEYITCSNDTIIDVVWCRIGYSDNWEGDPSRTNCSVTDPTCYKELDESAHNCSGLTECELDTCSESIQDTVLCPGLVGTNFMRINYTCEEESTATVDFSAPVTPTTFRTTLSISEVTSVSTSPEVTSASTSPDDKTTFIIIISVIGGVVIIVIPVTTVAVISHKKKKTRHSSNDDNKDSNDGFYEPPADYLDIDTFDDMRHNTIDDVTSRSPTSGVQKAREISYFKGTDLVDNTSYTAFDRRTTRNADDMRKGMKSSTDSRSVEQDTDLVDNPWYVASDYDMQLPRLHTLKTVPDDPDRAAS